jgi:hypothetical protein
MDELIDVAALEETLAPLSHGGQALETLQGILRPHKAHARQTILNRHMLRLPIRHEDVKGHVGPELAVFCVLQGDVIRTDAAYVLGERRDQNPTYVIATSTCDLVPGRRKTVSLLEVEPRRANYTEVAQIQNHLGQLTMFKSTQHLYLPPLPDDPPEVLFNVAHLDATAQCENAVLPFVQRRASMTLIGWRVSGAFLRDLQIRAGEEELAIRRVAQQLP